MYHDQQYLDLIDTILKIGVEKPNRTGVNTIGIFGYQMSFNLRDGSIPLLTTKKMHTKSIIHELLWFIKGDTNIKYLNDNGVTIWDEWADEHGDLGPVYGHQWRKWKKYDYVEGHSLGYIWEGGHHRVTEVDQIKQVIERLKTNPNDRRLLVSAWNPGEIDKMALPPCHYSFQLYACPLTTQQRVYIATQKYNPNDIFDARRIVPLEPILDEMEIPTHQLSMLVNQRSCDTFLGVPFNIAQYGIFLHTIAHVVKMAPGDLIWNGGDVHIYTNHIEQCKQQMTRSPYNSPRLVFKRDINSIDDFKYEDFEIVGYQHHPAILAPIAI